MNVFCLGSNEIDKHWNQIAPHLERLASYQDPEDTRRQLKDASLQLWGLQDGPEFLGVVITRISGKTCEVVGAAGSAPYYAMQVLNTDIESWARSIGCKRMRLMGRKGWIRLMGYTQTGIVAEKEL